MGWDKHREDFLWFSYFGVTRDEVEKDIAEAIKTCAERAYLDLSRTIGYEVSSSTIDENKTSKEKYKNYFDLKTKFKNNIIQELCKSIEVILSEKNMTQEKYDKKHEELCEFIVKEGKKQSYKAEVEGKKVPLFKEGKKITYGQAQKWVNMTFKNLLVMEEIKNEATIGFLHIPLDSYIFKVANNELGVKNNLGEWSKITSYNDYYEFQKAVREKLEKKSPIEWECVAWIKQAKDEKKNNKEKEKSDNK